MRLQSLALGLSFGLVLALSPIHAIEKPSEMSTEQILSELTLNNLDMMNSSDVTWRLSQDLKKDSQESQNDLKISQTALEESKVTVGLLVTNQTEQASLVTEMTAFSKSLAEDLAKEQKKNRNKNIAIWSLVGTTVLATTIAILK